MTDLGATGNPTADTEKWGATTTDGQHRQDWREVTRHIFSHRRQLFEDLADWDGSDRGAEAAPMAERDSFLYHCEVCAADALGSGKSLYVYRQGDEFVVSDEWAKDWLFRAYPGGKKILSMSGKAIAYPGGGVGGVL